LPLLKFQPSYNRSTTPFILWLLGFKGLQFCNICSKSNYFSKIIS